VLNPVGVQCEVGKHRSPLEAAKFELEEEAALEGGTWVPLMARPGVTVRDAVP
jgi:hypothetical protein